MENFETLINRLDERLFAGINSQSTPNDKKTLLACQSAVRNLTTGYNYLEIGSYLGGSIQPHLLDDRCRRIFSIDKRPLRQPDERGVDYTYLNNSTERMLKLLSEVAPVDKITTIDGDTRDISPAAVGEKMQLCFIDGEHTTEAVFADFLFCLKVVDENAAILFHDAPITYNGLAKCVGYLQETGRAFRAYSLPDAVFAVELGDFPLHRHPPILDRLTDNYESYLFSLQANDYYRQFANKAPFLFYRKLVTKWKKLNVFE